MREIDRLEREAQEAAVNGEPCKPFDLVGPAGRLRCEWLDPHFGFFRVAGQEGFVRVSDVPEIITAEAVE